MCIYTLLQNVVAIIPVIIRNIFQMSDSNLLIALIISESTEMAIINLFTFVRHVVLEPYPI